jgi:hypothetical protein
MQDSYSELIKLLYRTLVEYFVLVSYKKKVKYSIFT